MTILNPEALQERANNLGSFNGMELVLVELVPAEAPTEAHLLVHFFNAQELGAIATDIAFASVTEAGTSKTRLDFIGNPQNIVLVTQGTNLL